MQIRPNPLTAAAFAPFGDVLEASGDFRPVNAGLAARFHDRARVDIADGRSGISIFRATSRSLPYSFDLIERHPLGSQAFIPMQAAPFLVIVAPGPGTSPVAFLTDGTQGINLHRGTWHGVLAPLALPESATPQLFAVIDRIGDGPNLEEYRYAAPWTVLAR